MSLATGIKDALFVDIELQQSEELVLHEWAHNRGECLQRLCTATDWRLSCTVLFIFSEELQQYFFECSLHKQIGCFNHWVVTLVAARWGDSCYERFTLVIETNCIRQPENKLPWYVINLIQFILQPQYTNNTENICELGVIQMYTSKFQ